MKNLPIRIRLASNLFVLMVPIAMLTYQLASKLSVEMAFTEKEKKGIMFESPVLNLLDEIADFQVSALKNQAGDQEALKDMQEGSASIDQLFQKLTEIDNQIGRDLDFTVEGLKAHNQPDLTVATLIKKWQAIKAKPADQPAYTELLSNLSSVVKHIGDASNMILDPDLDSY